MTTDTRQRIVEAATRVLAREGYPATSVKDIAAEAGVAAGLVHYYFRTKEDLVAAAVEFACEQMWPEDFDQAPPEQAALAAFEEAKEWPEDRQRFHSLFVEMLGHALRNPAVRESLAATARRDRDQIEAAARAVLAQREDRSLAEAPGIAAAIWGASFGINVQRVLDPTFDADAAFDALREMALR